MGLGLDLMILDIPDDLPIPHVSSPTTDVHEWNKLRPKFLDNAFDFVSCHLQDAGAILLFFSDDLNLKATQKGFNNTYGFTVFREWMGINRLQMINAKDKSTTVCIQFLALLLVLFQIYTSFNFVHLYSNLVMLTNTSILHKAVGQEHARAFSFQPVQELLDFDIYVSSDDVLHNLVTKETLMMKGTIPWRGCREKDPLLHQMLIEATTSPGDIIMDYSTLIGLILYFNL